LSWTIAPEHRGKGHGECMVRALLALELGPVFAQIRKTNVASIRIAISVGMNLTRTDDEYVYFERK
jgi:RimJ/RimL family protein N-acetyltransferase